MSLPSVPDPVPYKNPRELPGMKVIQFSCHWVDAGLRDIADWMTAGEAERCVESVVLNYDAENDMRDLIVVYSETEH